MTTSDKAATLAIQTFLARVPNGSFPVKPEELISSYPGTVLLPYADIAKIIGVSREEVINLIDPARDANSIVINLSDGRHFRIIGYNAKKAFNTIRCPLARELGHIVFDHVGVKDPMARHSEAVAFAQHLLFPRALIAILRRRGIPITDKFLSDITGACLRCVRLLETAQPCHVDGHLNRQMRDRMLAYLDSLYDAERIPARPEGNLLDLSSYMEGYEE